MKLNQNIIQKLYKNIFEIIINNSLCLFFIISIGSTYSQIEIPNSFSNTGERYITSKDGIIRMYINVWGHVENPGRILIKEGTDIATLLALTGGPKKGANMRKVRVYHEFKNQDGSHMELINFKQFIDTGDRSDFISIQPNDTFIIKQTNWSYFIQEIATINTLMSLVSVYLNFNYILTNND